MAITAHTFPKFEEKKLTKLVDLTTDVCKAVLLSAYTYDDAHATLADVLAAGTQVGTSGTGYTSGGMTLSGLSIVTTAKVTKVTADSPQVVVPLAGSLAFSHVVFIDAQGGANTTRYPFAYWDLGGTFTYNDTAGGTETVVLTINAAGICTYTAS